MTFKETVEIIGLIDDLALWSRAEGRELQKETVDCGGRNDYMQARKYAAETKESLFNYIKDMKG